MHYGLMNNFVVHEMKFFHLILIKNELTDSIVLPRQGNHFSIVM